MKIKKSDLEKLIRESVQSFVGQEAGLHKRKGNTRFFLQLEVGEVEVETYVSPTIPADYWSPAEGGDVEIVSLFFQGREVSLQELAQLESEIYPTTEDEIYERIEEQAREEARDRTDYDPEPDYGY